MVELVDRAHVQAHDIAVVAGDLVALAEFRGVLDQLLHHMQHARQRFDAHYGLQLITEGLGVDLDGEAANHPAFFQAAHPLRGAGGGEADPARQFLEGNTRVFKQHFEDALVELVDHFCVSPLNPENSLQN